MKFRIGSWLNSLTAKYVAVFTLLVAVPAIGISWYLLDSSYSDNKRALIVEQQAEAKALAGRIDQSIVDVGDRVRGIHGSGLSRAQLALVLRPLVLSSLTPLLAFYMNAKAPWSSGRCLPARRQPRRRVIGGLSRRPVRTGPSRTSDVSPAFFPDQAHDHADPPFTSPAPRTTDSGLSEWLCLTEHLREFLSPILISDAGTPTRLPAVATCCPIP